LGVPVLAIDGKHDLPIKRSEKSCYKPLPGAYRVLIISRGTDVKVRLYRCDNVTV